MLYSKIDFRLLFFSYGICLHHINGNVFACFKLLDFRGKTQLSGSTLLSRDQGPNVVNDRATALFLRQRASLSVFHFSGKIAWNICICSFSVVPSIHFSYFVGSYYILLPGYQCKLHCFEVPQDLQPLCNTHIQHIASRTAERVSFVP